jgi:hypothetical protein
MDREILSWDGIKVELTSCLAKIQSRNPILKTIYNLTAEKDLRNNIANNLAYKIINLFWKQT